MGRYIKVRMMAIAVVLVLSSLYASTNFEETYNYDIKIAGTKVGYHSVKFNYQEKGFSTEATTYYKIKAGSLVKEFSLNEKGIYGPTGEPRIYSLEAVVNDSGSTIKVTVYGDTAHIETQVGDKSFVDKLKLTRPIYLLDRFMFGQYTIFFRHIDLQGLKAGKEFDILVPQMKRVVKLRVSSAKRDTSGRREIYRISGSLGESEFNAEVDVAMKNLLRLEFPAEKILVLTTETPEEFPEEPVEITDLTLGKLFMKPSKAIRDPRKVVYLRVKGDIEFSVVGGAQNYLNNAYQTFVGAENPGIVSGEFKIRTPEVVAVEPVPFPFDYSSKVDKEYLSADFMIPADDSAVIETALRLSAGKSTVWDVVKAFTRFVSDSIKYYPGSEDALETLRNRRGSTLSKVLLHMALCRAVGIPARIIGGLLYSNGLFIQHNWDEVFINESLGFIPVDPTLGEDEFFNATHISLWRGYGTLNPSEKGSIIEILEYKTKK